MFKQTVRGNLKQSAASMIIHSRQSLTELSSGLPSPPYQQVLIEVTLFLQLLAQPTKNELVW